MNEEEKKAIKYFYNLRATIDESNMLFDEDINVKCGKETIKQITAVLNLLEKKDKIIDLMAEEISKNILNTCPLADYNVDLDCENKCQDNYKECWKQYFEKKVEG